MDFNDYENSRNDSLSEISSINQTDASVSDIGEHFIELLKLSNMPESLLPDPEYVRNFFSGNEDDKEFASFLMTLGPQNFVTQDQVARYQDNISQGITNEDVDKYLHEKLGDQTNLVPVTSEIIDKHVAKLKQTEEEFKQLEEINIALKSELKGQNKKMKNLNEAIAVTEKAIKDKVKDIQTTTEGINKKSEVCLSMSLKLQELDVKEVIEIEAQIYDIINHILSALIEGKEKQTEVIKNISCVSRCPENTDNNLLEKFKELQYEKIEKITNNLMNIILKLNSLNKLICVLHQSEMLPHMSAIVEYLVYELDDLNRKVQDILSIKPDSEKVNFDDRVKELNSILNNSSSASSQKLLESLKNVDIDDKPLTGGMKNLLSDLINSCHTLETLLSNTDVDSEVFKEFLKNKETTQKLPDAAHVIKERSFNKELLLLMITDPDIFLSKLVEIEEKIKLFEKAVLNDSMISSIKYI